MHINKNTLTEPLTSTEKAHMNSCQQCTYEYEALSQLHNSVEQIELIPPPQSDWLEIQQRMANKAKVKAKVKLTSPIQWFISVAASAFIVAVGWLAWSNHHLQGQLEEVLYVNQMFELQLMQDSIPTFQQSQLQSQIRTVELLLIDAKTPKEKLSLLKARQKIIAEMVINTQGVQHEFSI